ncbi:MAG: YjbH domain-containing protein, partial [Thermodesulfovibrionia bacterium]|nr:YjbH domain-containing protein [Thermodesulfovibrionia bacterium]
MEIPTARVMRENSYRLGFSQIKPYRYYYGVLSPFKGLEVDLRLTEGLDVPSGLLNQKNFKDKALDVKYQFIPEGKYIPAISLGITDPHGTRVYPSQYIVASKQIYPFDFTLGFGNGRFGKEPLIESAEGLRIEMITDPEKWFTDSQFFWGIQFAPSQKIALMVEYSPIKYHEQTKDPAQPIFFRNPVHSKYNFGIRLKPTKWSEVGVSYQRGNQIGIHVSTAFGIGKPLIPIHDPL